MKKYNVYYNDGAYYGTMTFKNKPQIEIERLIQAEIDRNNKNLNNQYHITRANFKNNIKQGGICYV